MINRAFIVPLLCSVPLCAQAAGTINLSLSQQFDALGKPLGGCKLYFFQAGTTTPQNAYADTDLTIALPNPLECDSAGRLQQFFLADGEIKIRLADKNGATVLTADNILVIGPSAGGGTGGAIDPSTIYQTADLKVRYGTGAHSGWVRANGRTIGNATSGAAERANSDTQALWEHLCTNDTALRATISGGYSGNCTTDYNANKTIQLPDYRGMAIAGLDDMGASAAGRLTVTYFGTAATSLGVSGGGESYTLGLTQIPSHDHGGASGLVDLSHTHSYVATNQNNQTVGSAGASANSGAFSQASGGASINMNHSHTITAAGGGLAHRTVQPTRLATIYVKL